MNEPNLATVYDRWYHTVNNTVHRCAPMPVMVVNGDVVGDVIGDEVTTDELLMNLHTSNGFSMRIRVASEFNHDIV